MLVKDIMSKDVVTTDSQTSVREAARIMADNSVSCIVIAEGDDIAGIVTESDILFTFADGRRFDYDKKPVSDIMSKSVFQIESEADVKAAVELMVRHKIKKLPVVETGKLVGIITTGDIAASQTDVIENIGKLISRRLKKLVT